MLALGVWVRKKLVLFVDPQTLQVSAEFLHWPEVPG